jgi:hypothetical protein
MLKDEERKKKAREYVASNKEKIAVYSNEYYMRNKERINRKRLEKQIYCHCGTLHKKCKNDIMNRKHMLFKGQIISIGEMIRSKRDCYCYVSENGIIKCYRIQGEGWSLKKSLKYSFIRMNKPYSYYIPKKLK